MAKTPAQKRANKKWRDKNKQKVNAGNYKSNAGTFIREYATISELLILRHQIDEQVKFLRTKPQNEPFGEYVRRNGEIQMSIIEGQKNEK
jgi:hypothetical protein